MDILDLQDLESVYKGSDGNFRSTYEVFYRLSELWENLKGFQKTFLIRKFCEKGYFTHLYEETEEIHPVSPALEGFLNSFKVI